MYYRVSDISPSCVRIDGDVVMVANTISYFGHFLVSLRFHLLVCIVFKLKCGLMWVAGTLNRYTQF